MMFEFFLASTTVFMLAFSILWFFELKNHVDVGNRISSYFESTKFADQKVSERDRIFKLFPLEPSPVLFKKLELAEDMLTDPTFRLSTKYLGSMLVSIVFGMFYATLQDIELKVFGVNLLTIEVAVFGLIFFVSRYFNSSKRSNLSSKKLHLAESRSFLKLLMFFLGFGVLVPIFVWALEPSNLSTIDQSISTSPAVAEIVLEDEQISNTSRLMWTIEFAQITALLIPVFLFFFSMSDAKLRVEQQIFEDEDIALGSMARIKEIASVLLSVVGALTVLDVDLSSLSLFSGLAAAGLSVAMRETITNFFSGLQMTWDRSLKIGDVISIPQSASNDTGSTYGIVKDIRSRYTVIEDRNTVRRLVPNFQMVSETIEHWTHEDDSVRLSLRVGIPYVEDHRQVRQAQRIMESVCYDVPRVLTSKPPNALLVQYEESHLTFSLRFWIEDAQNGIRPVISEVLISLYERLSDAGIKIPFPQQDVYIKELPKWRESFFASQSPSKDTADSGDSDE